MLISEENIISLGKACFWDDGVIGFLDLMLPSDQRCDELFAPPGCWVYKRKLSWFDRARGRYRNHRCHGILRGLKPTRVRENPLIRFLWSDSGQSVAVIVDGEPFAFIAERKNRAYSRGVKDEDLVGQDRWDERVFRETFQA